MAKKRPHLKSSRRVSKILSKRVRDRDPPRGHTYMMFALGGGEGVCKKQTKGTKSADFCTGRGIKKGKNQLIYLCDKGGGINKYENVGRHR